MEPSSDAEAILNLGRKLVRELELENTCETLSKWMAHYLAEQMAEVESAKSRHQRDAAQNKCCELILKIWDKRSSLPGSAKPFGHIEEALKSLIAMQAEQNEFARIFNSQVSSKKNAWLEFAEKTNDIEWRLMRISFLTGLLENNFGAEKQWVDDHSEALSDDEKNLITALDGWLNLRNQYFATADDRSMADFSPEERFGLVLKELDKLSKKQRQVFLDLKKRLSQRG